MAAPTGLDDAEDLTEIVEDIDNLEIIEDQPDLTCTKTTGSGIVFMQSRW